MSALILLIRNLLTILGLLTAIIIFVNYKNYQPYVNLFLQLDSQSRNFAYQEIKKLANMEPHKIRSYLNNIKSLDPKARDVYLNMFDKLLTTGNSVAATVWKVPVNSDLSVEDVIETMKFVANEKNISNVGELPLSKDIEAKLGNKFRYISIHLFCNSLIAAQMLEYDDAFSAYLPCRIALVEDNKGKLWLYSLNMDMMIYGGRPLPQDLLKQALNVRETIIEIMQRSAKGEF